jgi:hypothetical protein
MGPSCDTWRCAALGEAMVDALVASSLDPFGTLLLGFAPVLMPQRVSFRVEAFISCLEHLLLL